MHVAINGWFVGQSAAGSGQYIHHLLEYLPRHAPGVAFSLLLPIRSEPPAKQWSGIDTVELRLPPLPGNVAKLWWEQVTVPRAASQLDADLLWTPYWAAPLWQPCASVVTIHDLIPSLLDDYRGGALQRAYTALVSYTGRRSDAVIAVSQAGADDIVRVLDIPADRVHVVHHGPNQEGQPAPDAAQCLAVRQRYHLPERYFLYLGGFDVRKNVRTTLAAYQRYLARGGDPAVRLVLAGRTPQADSAFAPDPRKIISELGLTAQVDLCGWIDEADKPAIYTMATAFLFPSLYEGFGMMVLEAMAAGTPVITSVH